jgi:hypothetical protein
MIFVLSALRVPTTLPATPLLVFHAPQIPIPTALVLALVPPVSLLNTRIPRLQHALRVYVSYWLESY